MKRSYSLLLILAMALAMVMSMAASVFADDTALEVKNKYNMFKPTTAVLKDDNTLLLTYESASYDKAYVGTAAQAVLVADKAKTVERTEGVYALPLDTIEGEFPVAFHSVKNKGWYDRIFKIDTDAKTLTTDTPGTPIVPDDLASDWDEDVSVDSSIGMFQIAKTKVVIDDNGKVSVKIMAGNPNRSFPKIALIEQTATEEEKEDAAIVGIQVGDTNDYIYEFDVPASMLADGIPFSTYQTYKGASEWHNWKDQHTLTINSASVVNQLIEKIQVQKNSDFTPLYIELSKKCWDALPEDQQGEDDGYFSDDTGDASLDDPLNAVPDREKEMLVVSFGTSFNGSRAATIGAVEKELQRAFPTYAVRRAFTAQIIINHVLARDGEQIDNVKEAMDKAVAAGVKQMVIQPTHLMSGKEYEELKEEIDEYADKMDIYYGKPLLHSDEDKTIVAKALVDEAVAMSDYDTLDEAAEDKCAFVFMGHGTSHEAAKTYDEMQAKMDELGYGNVIVGTVEGIPEDTSLPEVKKVIDAKGFKKVILRPMMVVAGDHANNDMAGDWADALINGGEFTVEGETDPVNLGDGLGKGNVTSQINGLGEIRMVQGLYVIHAGKATPEKDDGVPAIAEEMVKKIQELVLKYATDENVIAAYDTALKYFDEYRALVDVVVDGLRTGDTSKLAEYGEMLDEYIKLGNKYAVEFQKMPEVKEALEKTVEKAKELRDLLKKYGIEKPEDVCDKIDEIKAEIEKAQADFEAALEEFINVTAKELLEEAAKELEKQAKEWAKDAGFTDEDIEQFMEMAKALQALLEEYKGLTPDEALDKAIADVKKAIEDNADLLTELAMEQLAALQEKWDNGDFDEYLEQAGLDRAQVEYIVKEIMAYVQGVSEGNTYQELQKQLEEAGKELEEKAAEIAELQDTIAALEQAKKEAEEKLAETEKALQEEKEKTAASEEQIKKLEEQAAKDAADLSKYENALKVMKAKPKMKSVKNKKGKKALVKFKGLKKLKATKYQVSYKAGKTKKKVLKKKTSSAKNLKLTLKKLKKGKKYTVKVRAAYTFKYKGQKYTVYSKWSKAKKVKIKK